MHIAANTGFLILYGRDRGKGAERVKIEVAVFGLVAAFVILGTLITVNAPQLQPAGAKSGLPVLGKAPELAGIKGWLNSEPLTIAGLKGKVVLVDFRTDSCINCIRTLPYLKDWHAKYADQGLVTIGVHTPEFEFEKGYDNVKAAIAKYGIKYAVAQDNDYATWNAFQNRYWPRKYLVDADGNMRYDHIGEGGYAETERAIQSLLAEAGAKVAANMTKVKETTDYRSIGTPELYLGYGFARAPLGNPEGFQPGTVVEYRPAATSQDNTVYLYGSWKNENDRMIAVSDGTVRLMYTAKEVNIVAGGNAGLAILLDGKTLTSENLGSDGALENGTARVTIDAHRLYNIVSTPVYGTHLLEIRAEPGFELYTFTFG
ncbi:MAG: thioredoxin family protein [Candidatus Aenigmarchaeota archaeon]|nr:thioredoxin family protein [Candidatus Aenigmarchaeota archaeon]